MRFISLTLLLSLAPALMAEEGPLYERIQKSPPTQEEIDDILLLPTVVDGISYIGGGIGVAERAALERWAKDYTLRIEMARRNGEYLGDMQVRLFDGQGRKILEARADGPLFFIQLPEGSYAVEVQPLMAEGPAMAAQSRDVKIAAGKQARVLFVWP
jgi:hypothetical protein